MVLDGAVGNVKISALLSVFIHWKKLPMPEVHVLLSGLYTFIIAAYRS